jgi:hypothetical protein
LPVIASDAFTLSHCEERSDVAISKGGIPSVCIEFPTVSGSFLPLKDYMFFQLATMPPVKYSAPVK